MKVMLYINTIGHGGAERVLVNLANQFYQSGSEVILVTSVKKDAEYALNDGVKRELLCDNMPSNFITRNYKLAKALRKCVKRESPDVLISFMAEPNFRAILATMRLKTKTLISVRNDPNREYSKFFHKIAAKCLYRYADGIVFQTEDAQKWFSKKIQLKSRIIFNQVDERFFNAILTADSRNVVTVGRLTEQKNHKLLIDAFARVSDKVADDLVIYGEGPMRKELEEYIGGLNLSERIHLPGVVDDVEKKINSAKLFVLSSDYEGMPNALIEAMTIGLPCISTDCPCGGPKALFKDGSGILVPINDVEKMSVQMLRLLTDKSERELLSKKAKEASSRFKPHAVFSQWREYAEYITR